MPHLIEVAFKGNRKDFYLWEGDDPPPLKAPIIVDADRGEDLGFVHSIGETAERRCAGCAHGAVATGAPDRRALRLAAPPEVKRADELSAANEEARRKGMERVRANGLVMKLSDAEWQWDRKKLTFFFTAEKRVDFRNLVRDLAALFRTRIELKQIGVRDEAKRLDGIGRCGRQYCSASWLPELRPVNLGVAKDQRLSLNPSQISGACGRLMCCLRYEHEFYVQSRKRFPKEGKIVVTAKGEEKVIANDIFNDRVTLRSVEGDTRVVPLADLRRELAASSADSIAEPHEEPATAEHAGDEEGDLSLEESSRGGRARAGAARETRDARERGERGERDSRGSSPDSTRGRPSRSRPAAPAPGARASRIEVPAIEAPRTVTERPADVVLEASPPDAPVPPSLVAPAPAAQPSAAPATRDTDGDELDGPDATDESDEQPSADGVDGADATDAPRTRRRRGRRGGRRNRGGDRGAPPTSTDSSEPAGEPTGE